MKKIITIFVLCFPLIGFAQNKVSPVVKNYGGIFEIPYADEKPDPTLDYKIVIEVVSNTDKYDSINWPLFNVARLLNLHVTGGVPKEKIQVVVVIHGGAAFTVMNNEAYKAKYGVDNPNLNLYQELQQAGVKMFVCGQSLIARKIDRLKMVPEVKIATSALTTLTTYQLKGHALLKF
ncbi:MAG: DsrE family protein [Flammeovirgaceae bacterium]|nr:DsrE family protein [Flammeovirgaceae bacterium]